MSALTDPAPSTVRPFPVAPPVTAGSSEHRRLLVGDLVVRRVSYRSVARVALPVWAGVCAALIGVGVLAWNVAALAGWSPADDQLAGAEVFWSGVAAAVVLVPLLVLATLGVTALYNTVSERVGGVEVAVVSPRHRQGPRDR